MGQTVPFAGASLIFKNIGKVELLQRSSVCPQVHSKLLIPDGQLFDAPFIDDTTAWTSHDCRFCHPANMRH
jgi:hypothetical protein